MTNKQKYKLVRNSITKTHIPKLFDELVKGGGGGTITEIFYKAPKKVKFDTLVDCDNEFFNGTGKITIYGPVSNFSLGKWTAGSSSSTGTSALDDECSINEITELIIPEGVVKTLEHVLPTNSNVEIIDLPDSLTEIGDESFNMLYNLTDIRISNNVVSIGAEAFAMAVSNGSSSTIGAAALINIDVPDSVTEIGENAFLGIDNVNYNGTAVDDGTHWGATAKNAYVEKPIIYEDETKTHILKCNTNKLNTTETIDIPDSVEIIDENAFSISINGSATIGAALLKSGIAEVNIPDSVTSIGNNSFMYIPNINYNDGFANNYGAFFKNAIVDLPYFYEDTNKTVGLKMIYEAVNNDDEIIELPNTITALRSGFTDDANIDYFISNKKCFSITIPDSVSSIGGDCFVNVPNVNYNGSGTSAFIKSMFINKYVENGVVYENDTDGIALMYLASDNLTITNIKGIDYSSGYQFDNVDNITSIYLPNCTYISNYSFANTNNLKDVGLDNCLYIGDYAFINCALLTSVDLSYCTNIGKSAFANCNSLKYVLVDRVTIPQISTATEQTFYGCNSLTAIFVPDSCVNDYKNAWDSYSSLITGISYM